MTLRDQLTSQALLGAAQPMPEWPPTQSPLDPLLARLKEQPPAQRLLKAIALVTSYESAGAGPRALPEPPTPAAVDPRLPCSGRAASHLARIVADQRNLLQEWLALCAAARRRAPAEAVPALLDAASHAFALREPVLGVVGPVGPWLAQFHEGWRWILQASVDEDVWHHGEMPGRLAFLRHLRATDAARARGLVESAWPSENAEARRQLLETFGVGLSADDEELLEKALDDRSIVVRRAAAGHLSALASSAYVGRMIARLQGHLKIVKTGLLGRTKTIDINLLDGFDPTMARDAIDKTPPTYAGVGERAWWTGQALAAVPPAYWVKQLELNPAQLLTAARAGQWATLLLEAWRKAALRHRDMEWIRLFLLPAEEPVATDTTTALFHALEAPAREAAMLPLLEKDQVWFYQLAVNCAHKWSLGFTEQVLAMASRRLLKDDSTIYTLRHLLRECIRYADPAARLAKEAEHEAFAEFTDLLAFRREMSEALEEKPDA